MAIDERAYPPRPLAFQDDLFRRFVERSPDAIAISRLSDGRLLEVNQPFLDMMAFTRDQVIGRTTLEIGLWAASEERERMLRSLEDGPSARVDFELHTSAGEVRDIEASVQLVEMKGERCIMAIDRDVTDRKRAEVARRETEAMLRATIESTADGILVVDEHGRSAHANRRFAEMWRIPDEVLATGSDEHILEFVLDQVADPNVFLSKVRELYQTDQASFDTLRFKDGRTFERYSVPLVHDGRMAGRVWSFRDTTERYRAEEALREAETKYRTLLEHIPAVTYVDPVEGSDTTIYISPQSEAMFGYSPKDWTNDPELLSRIIDPADREAWREANARCDLTGEPLKVEYRIRARDGRTVWVRDEAVLLRDRGGRAQYWQGVMFDITERKHAERQLELAWQKELEAGQRLRALDEMKNTFLEAVSHELRTPLTALLGSALTLERTDVRLSDDDRKDLVRRLASNARKLNRLLSDLLDLDRLGRGIMEPKRQPTDLSAVAAMVIAESEMLGGHSVEFAADRVVVSVDASKVERIVENLLANAARHTPAGTRIWLRVERTEGGALIGVDDEGPGVAPELRERIFQPFRQAPSSHRHQPGVGIGLTLVARFAELHGGRAWVEERPGGGASFRVFLPDAAEQTDPTREPVYGEVPPEA